LLQVQVPYWFVCVTFNLCFAVVVVVVFILKLSQKQSL